MFSRLACLRLSGWGGGALVSLGLGIGILHKVCIMGRGQKKQALCQGSTFVFPHQFRLVPSIMTTLHSNLSGLLCRWPLLFLM
jgi:hypothetical protein